MTTRQSMMRLAIEMAIMVTLAVVIGVSWNYRLLANAWTGKSAAAPKAAEGVSAPIPLPLGLMQVKELYDGKEATFIDSRDRVAYGSGHIKGAISLPLMDAATAIPEFGNRVPKNATLVVYCSGYACEDSMELGRQLLAIGYTTVYYFDGGFPAWRDAGYPIARRP